MDNSNLSKRERRAERRRGQTNNESSFLKHAGIWIGTVLLIVIGVYFLAASTTGSNSKSNGNTAGTPAAIAADDWIGGNKNASTTLIEYSDFQCPACAAQYPIVKQAVQELGQNFRFVYRYFPLAQIHKNAELASYAAEAAGSQGKFWEMHDKLFESQTEWADSDNARSLFMNYAKQLNLDVKKFGADLDSGAVHDRIARDENEGNSIGIDATPTFFLDGKQLQQNPRGYDDLKQILESAIQGNLPIK